MTRFQVLYWQDVPSLVKVHGDDGATVSYPLPDRFQDEIDRRAMEQGLVESDAYLEHWRWGELEERPETADAIVDALVAEWATQA